TLVRFCRCTWRVRLRDSLRIAASRSSAGVSFLAWNVKIVLDGDMASCAGVAATLAFDSRFALAFFGVGFFFPRGNATATTAAAESIAFGVGVAENVGKSSTDGVGIEM